MTRSQIFFKVTLLQMIKRIVPPMSNEIITLVKDTSLARIISLQEIIWAGYAFLKGSHGYSGLVWPLFFTGVYYLIFNGLLTLSSAGWRRNSTISARKEGATMPILEVNHINKSFGSTKVLDDISFSLDRGKALAIIGPPAREKPPCCAA